MRAESASAQLTEEYFLKFQSPFMEIVSDGSKYKADKAGAYPLWAQAIRHDWFKWNPTGESSALPPDCDFLKQRDQFLDSKTESFPAIRRYFERCEKTLQTGTNSLLLNAYLTDFIQLHPESHPYARHVVFHLPNGVRLKGLLALKGDDKPRPLVILRLGIFSNTREFFPERYMFLQMFEQSPFNMLVLESMSGAEFVQNNTRYSFGGYDEGIQNYQIARNLQRPSEPLSKTIDSVHLFGISLGGHGVLYASILNSLNQSVISSFATFCPLVNFKETFEFHQQQGLNMKFMSYWAQNRMPTMSQIFPNLDEENFIPSVLQQIDLNYAEALSYDPQEQLRLPPTARQRTYFEKNQFVSDFHDIKTPLLIFATKRDPIVPLALNSQKLMNQKSADTKVNSEFVLLEQGSHCTIPSAYHWQSWTSLMQSYVLKNSRLSAKKMQWTLPASFQDSTDIKFQVDSQGMFVVTGPWWNRHETRLPLELPDWSGLKAPLSKETQLMLTRWMNQNFRVEKDSDSQSFQLRWLAI